MHRHAKRWSVFASGGDIPDLKKEMARFRKAEPCMPLKIAPLAHPVGLRTHAIYVKKVVR